MNLNSPRGPYKRAAGGLCPSCIAKGHHYRMDQAEHFRLHIPRDRWPESMRTTHKERVVIDGRVFNKGEEPGARSEFELRAIPAEDVMVERQYTRETSSVDLSGAVDFHSRECTCGYSITKPSKAEADKALAMHRRMAKAHKEPVSA